MKTHKVTLTLARTIGTRTTGTGIRKIILADKAEFILMHAPFLNTVNFYPEILKSKTTGRSIL